MRPREQGCKAQVDQMLQCFVISCLDIAEGRLGCSSMREHLRSMVKALSSISAQISNTKEFYHLFTLGYGTCDQHRCKVTFSLPCSVSACFTLMLSFLPETYLLSGHFTVLILGRCNQVALMAVSTALSTRYSFYPTVAGSRVALEVLDWEKKECASDG